MEDLLARERAAEQHFRTLLKSTDEPILNLLQALEKYRQASLVLIFADYENSVANREVALWNAHSDCKKYFHRALSNLRKQHNEQPVATRTLMKLYLQFIKDSQRFYRAFIPKLNASFGGITELQVIAHLVSNGGSGESSQSTVSPELRQKVLHSCHEALVYLGDLSRYRASEKLDKNPDFGPAIGFYRLACTLRPSSGKGHHQLAVIALDQRQHLRGIYHLYHSMVVVEPHPNAASNLKLEFDKTNAAWDRGELIQKGPPNDPENSKRTLVGWFVRLHSMCFKGEEFRGHDELESEVIGQLAAEIKQRSLDSTLMRMVMVNFAAEFDSSARFRANPSETDQTAFLHFFRLNIKTFSTLLRIFYDDLKAVDITTTDDDDDEVKLANRLTDVARRVLPALRLYSSWLLPNNYLLDGLSEDPSLKDPIDQFWRLYAKTVDLVAAVFPIWDLEEVTSINYMLEEDTDTLCFKPLTDETTTKIWYEKKTGTLKPRFSDSGVIRASSDQEMLSRVKEFLADGLFLANDVKSAPIKLQETRILHRDAEDVVISPTPAPVQSSKAEVPPPAVEPLSYAATAADGPVSATSGADLLNGIPSAASAFRHAQLTRMVDDLVDDDDGNNPVTPPQQYTRNPAVVTKGDVSYSGLPGSVPDFAKLPNYSYQPKQDPIGTPSSTNLRTPKNTGPTSTVDRLQSVSSLWNDTPSSSFPAGLPTGTLGSPAPIYRDHGHSRVNSASSFRSRTSQGMNMGVSDSWSSLESSAPRLTAGGFGHESEQSVVASPLLFGMGGPWSNVANAGSRNISPPKGHGG